MNKLGYYIQHKPVVAAMVLICIAALVLFFRLGSTPIYILDEAKNAQCAREMMERNDWIVPTFNNELRPHKPPLHYFCMWASCKVFGVNPFGARFPSALLGLFTLIASWWFIKKFTDAHIALYALLTLSLSTHFLFEFRMSVPDPYLIFFTSFSLFSFFAYIQENKGKWILLAAISMALAVLAKGPVALALPGLSVLIGLVLEKKLRLLFKPVTLLAAALFCAIAVPWYVLVHQATSGAFTKGFFLEHNIQRFNEPMEGHGGFFLLVPLFVFVGLLPLSVFFIRFIAKAKIFCKSSMVNFCLIITIVFIVFFSVSGTKLPNYPMPCYPFASLLIAYALRSVMDIAKPGKIALITGFVISAILLIAAIIGFQLDPSLKPLFAWSFIFLLPVAGIGWALYVRKKSMAYSLAAIAILYTLFNLLGLGLLYPAIYKNNPVSSSVHLLKQSMPIYAYHIYNPAFNFYVNQTIKTFSNRAELEKQLSAGQRAIVITRENFLPELQGLPLIVLNKMKDPLELPTTVVLQYK